MVRPWKSKDMKGIERIGRDKKDPVKIILMRQQQATCTACTLRRRRSLSPSPQTRLCCCRTCRPRLLGRPKYRGNRPENEFWTFDGHVALGAMLRKVGGNAVDAYTCCFINPRSILYLIVRPSGDAGGSLAFAVVRRVFRCWKQDLNTRWSCRWSATLIKNMSAIMDGRVFHCAWMTALPDMAIFRGTHWLRVIGEDGHEHSFI